MPQHVYGFRLLLYRLAQSDGSRIGQSCLRDGLEQKYFRQFFVGQPFLVEIEVNHSVGSAGRRASIRRIFEILCVGMAEVTMHRDIEILVNFPFIIVQCFRYTGNFNRTPLSNFASWSCTRNSFRFARSIIDKFIRNDESWWIVL